jgi:hypothetical protein
MLNRRRIFRLSLLLAVGLSLIVFGIIVTAYKLPVLREGEESPVMAGQDIQSSQYSNRQMTKEEVLELLKDGKAKGFLSGNIPSDPRELDQLAEAILRDASHQRPTQKQKGIMNGRQQLMLKRDFAAEWQEGTDRRLPIFFDGPEWSALFLDVLGYNGGTPFVPGDDITEWTKRHQVEFQESIPNYPMLARIWDTFIDVEYAPEEIAALKNECLRVKATTSNVKAVEGLNKLIFACDEATKSSLGLLLSGE